MPLCCWSLSPRLCCHISGLCVACQGEAQWKKGSNTEEAELCWPSPSPHRSLFPGFPAESLPVYLCNINIFIQHTHKPLTSSDNVNLPFCSELWHSRNGSVWRNGSQSCALCWQLQEDLTEELYFARPENRWKTTRFSHSYFNKKPKSSFNHLLLAVAF